jgi:hypothetical protein
MRKQQAHEAHHPFIDHLMRSLENVASTAVAEGYCEWAADFGARAAFMLEQAGGPDQLLQRGVTNALDMILHEPSQDVKYAGGYLLVKTAAAMINPEDELVGVGMFLSRLSESDRRRSLYEVVMAMLGVRVVYISKTMDEVREWAKLPVRAGRGSEGLPEITTMSLRHDQIDVPYLIIKGCKRARIMNNA